MAILEDVNNHTNLGAIFRGAAALGIDAVLLSPSCADPLYRRSVRVSMGEVFAVPYARLEPWPAALAQVREAGFTVLALTPAADAVPIQRLDAGGSGRGRRCCSAPRAPACPGAALAGQRRPGARSRCAAASTRSTWPRPPRSPSGSWAATTRRRDASA